ncbi:thiamine pyrophosphate-binding protein [Amycolatopsis sp. M39]|nr:thiamine pyrophosphate-dependent enzyme [Amycolatopsis sp. M39]OAP21198.1 Benzoylformate decarboxylase [Amycolatopsis sp. M39]
MGEPEYGSDVVADLLAGLGIEYLACNPGATFRGLHDSLVNYRAEPRLVECAHEEIAVAIAHGYAKASGRMMAVALHDVVGLQHASMAVYNAWCDRVPVLLLGGTGPVDAARRRPWIDWIHTALPQAAQIRDYTKWDDQPASIEAVPESLVRAHRIAAAAPAGPVYVCLDSDVQEQPVGPDFRYRPAADYAVPRPLVPEPAAITTAVDWLAEAVRPVIAVESVDFSAQATADLAVIAETLGAAVVEPARDYGRPALCLPFAHPMNATGALDGLGPADVVVSLEVRDLATTPVAIGPGARIAQFGTAPLGARAWAADLQRIQHSALTVHASPAPTLAALRAEIERRALPRDDRAARLAAHTRAARTRWATTARTPGPGGAITQANLAAAVWAAVREHEPVLANGSLSDWAHRTWELSAPRDYLGSSGGAGLGYGLGASIGAALAHRDDDRLVVDLQSDGDLLMTPGALWTAAHEKLPLLIVTDNNRAYQNSVHHARIVAGHRDRDPANAVAGTTLTDPPVDIAGLARSLGVRALGPISRAEDLATALGEAVTTVIRERRTVLVDVLTATGT